MNFLLKNSAQPENKPQICQLKLSRKNTASRNLSRIFNEAEEIEKKN